MMAVLTVFIIKFITLIIRTSVAKGIQIIRIKFGALVNIRLHKGGSVSVDDLNVKNIFKNVVKLVLTVAYIILRCYPRGGMALT